MNIYNYNHLFYFYITAKLKGVTAAAKYLNTSQSSLSIQIKTLEGTLGRKLFQKIGRKIELTDSGKELYQYCRRAFEVFDEMFDQIKKNKSSMGIRIALGASLDIEKPFIAEALSKITKNYHKDQRPLLHLISLPSSQLVQLLKIGELDFLLTTGALIDNELQILAEFNFPVGAYSARDFLEGVKKPSVESLVKNYNTPFVLPSKLTSLRSEIDHYFVRKRLNPICVFESNIISSVVRATNDKMGISILPEVYIKREIRAQKLIPLSPRPLWFHRITLLSSRQKADEGRQNFINKLALHFKEISNF